MQIRINGEFKEFAAPLTVSELLDTLDMDTHRIAVELNSQIVPRSSHSEQHVQDGDHLEIVHAIGGG